MNRLTIHFTILAIAMIVLGQNAQAQIASPRLNPMETLRANPFFHPTSDVVLFDSSSPFNPAVDIWRDASHLGVGVGNHDSSASVSGPQGNFDVATGDSQTVQLALVGEMFAFSARVANHDMEIDPGLGTGTFTIDTAHVGLSAKLGEILSLGVGFQSEENHDETQGPGNEITLKEEMPLGGVTLRLGEMFFVGGAYGTETVDAESPQGPASGDRAVTNIGVGIQTRDGDTGFHIEIYKSTEDLLELFEPGGNEVYSSEGEKTGATLEVVFSNILLGVESLNSTSEVNNPFPPPGVPVLRTGESKETMLSVGWIPQEGLSLVVSATENELTEYNGDVVTYESGAATLFWRF